MVGRRRLLTRSRVYWTLSCSAWVHSPMAVAEEDDGFWTVLADNVPLTPSTVAVLQKTYGTTASFYPDIDVLGAARGRRPTITPALPPSPLSFQSQLEDKVSKKRIATLVTITAGLLSCHGRGDFSWPPCPLCTSFFSHTHVLDRRPQAAGTHRHGPGDQADRADAPARSTGGAPDEASGRRPGPSRRRARGQ